MPFIVTVGPLAAANAANIVAANTPAGAGNLALVGGGPVVLDQPRKVLVTFGIEVANRVVTIFGTNSSGNAIKETVAVASGAAGTVATTQDFKTVTQVQVFAAWSVNMSVGTNGVASSPFIALDTARNPFTLSYAVWVNGTVTYQIEGTLDDPNAGYDPTGQDPTYANSIQPLSNVPPKVFPDPINFSAAKSANFQGTITYPILALRATLLSGGGSIQLEAVQAGYVGA